MRKFLSTLMTVIGVIMVAGFLISLGGIIATLNPPEGKIHENSLLVLELDDVIEDGSKFLEKLRKYREKDHIKGVLVQINSPGGVVGPSQEIYAELKRTREQFKKPVVATCLGMAASGAYYAAVAADKFIVNPGCMVGSIGAIMHFANLEKLWEWAKINRYTIKTGAYKDIGADYRPMSAEERQLLQEMLDDVLAQFKLAIQEGRSLKPEQVARYADGRIFTGDQAVKLGFADAVGTFDDARKVLGEMTGLGDKPELFKPRSRRPEDFWELFDSGADSKWQELAAETLNVKWRGQPLLVWPAALGL